MKKRDSLKLTMLAGLVLSSFAGALIAQDEVAAEAEVPAEEVAAPEAATPPVKPRPSELSRLAYRGLLLDVTTSGKHLFAVGDRGTVLVSNNARDWAQVQTPSRSALTGIAFADENIGYAVGHDAVILKTSDGGKTWLLQNFQPELEKPFLSVLALDADNVIALGAYGLMYRTSDGGSTWNEVNAPAIREEELHLNGIAKLGNGSLLVVGEQGTAGLSTDGGSNWEKLVSPYDGSLYGAIAVGDKGALIFGLRGNVYRSDDVAAGVWTQINVNTVSSFFGGTALPDGGVALVGLAGKVLRLDSSGGVSALVVTRPQTDANGNTTDKEVTGSFASAHVWAGRLVVVGEQGVQALRIN
ncbi:MAG: YCF48-related protein [Stagnimonas sp.]|nr:YCF48-related protein [Stagnimonas sp.]